MPYKPNELTREKQLMMVHGPLSYDGGMTSEATGIVVSFHAYIQKDRKNKDDLIMVRIIEVFDIIAKTNLKHLRIGEYCTIPRKSLIQLPEECFGQKMVSEFKRRAELSESMLYKLGDELHPRNNRLQRPLLRHGGVPPIVSWDTPTAVPQTPTFDNDDDPIDDDDDDNYNNDDNDE